MIEKKIFILLFIFLLFPNLIAQDLKIEIQPTYYYYSDEVSVYNNYTEFTGISFEIYGENLNDYYKLLNLTIVDSSIELKGKFSDGVPYLRISQEKLLWTSKIIDTNEFNELNVTVFVGVSGINEETLQEVYAEDKFNFLINKPEEKEKLFFERLGDTIWEENYKGGLFILFLLVIIFILLYNKYFNKLEKRNKINKQKLIKY